jgi:glycosyltransferase involved in cell wall biosynthesis
MNRVSAVIPTFNRDWCILRALDSVLAQTFRELDIWVVDDGGNDDTERLVRNRAATTSETPVHYLKIPHGGVSVARNAGVWVSTGSLIAFLDSDDEWLPDKLQRQIDCLELHPEAALVHGGESWIRDGQPVQVPEVYRKYGGDVYEHCLPVCMIGPSTVVVKREVLVEVGAFDESFPVCEDYDLWLRIASRWPVALVNEPVIRKYAGHADQLSTTTPTLDFWRVRALCHVLPTLPSDDPRHAKTLHELRRRGSLLARGYRKHGRESESRDLINRILEVDPDFAPAGIE